MIECTYTSDGVGKVLSNLYPHPFDLDGFHCVSMEGFLQSLKFFGPQATAAAEQARGSAGTEAYRFGQEGNNWKTIQALYWNGTVFLRGGAEYQELLTRAYDALAAQNQSFAQALIDTGIEELAHSIGKDDASDTVLTRTEYLGQLNRLRNSL